MNYLIIIFNNNDNCNKIVTQDDGQLLFKATKPARVNLAGFVIKVIYFFFGDGFINISI